MSQDNPVDNPSSQSDQPKGKNSEAAPALEEFLFELQDALLTGDQELIIATKKKYLEQVYLHRKVKTDADDAKKAMKQTKSEQQFLKQSQISRRQIMLEKEALLRQQEKDMDEQYKKMQARAKQEALDMEKRQKEILRLEKEKCKLANTHDKKIEEALEQNNQQIKEKQGRQMAKLNADMQEDEKKKQEAAREDRKKKEQASLQVRKKHEENIEQEKESKKQGKKVFLQEVKAIDEETNKKLKEEEDAQARQREIVVKRKKEAEDTQNLLESMDKAVMERKAQLEELAKKKEKDIEQKRDNEQAKIEEQANERDEKSRQFQGRAALMEDFRISQVEDKWRYEKFMGVLAAEEKQKYLEQKRILNLQKEQQAAEQRIKIGKQLVDKINGYVDKLESNDQMTQSLFESQQEQHIQHFEGRDDLINARRQQARRVQSAKQLNLKQQIEYKQYKANEIAQANRKTVMNKFEEKHGIIERNLKAAKQIAESKKQNLIYKMQMQDLHCWQSQNNKNYQQFIISQNKHQRILQQQMNIQNVQRAKKERILHLAQTISQKSLKIAQKEETDEVILEMNRRMLEQARLQREQQMEKLRKIQSSNRPASAKILLSSL